MALTHRYDILEARIALTFLLLINCTFALPGANVAAALITPAPVYNPKLLEKRASDQTCGYVSGNPDSPLVCPGTSSCSFAGDHWGCCDQLTCDLPATCELDASPYCEGLNTLECVYTQIRRCPSACVTYTRITGPNDQYPMSSWTCGPTAEEILIFITTTTGSGAVAASTRVTAAAVDSTSSSSSTSAILNAASILGLTSTSASDTVDPFSALLSSYYASLSTETSTAFYPTSTSPDGSSDQTTSPNTVSSHHNLSGGAIAGIVIGSLVGIIIIIILCLFIYKRISPSTSTSKMETALGSNQYAGEVPKTQPIPLPVEMLERMPGGHDVEFEDDRRWDGTAVDVRSEAWRRDENEHLQI